SFSLSAVQRHKKKGTASLTATLPNPGTLAVGGKLVKAQTLAISAEGDQPLTLVPTKKTRKRLKDKGKTSGPRDLTYTPSFGSASTQSLRVTLKLKTDR